MKVVALLPMKANSERLPNKNFRSFCGKPLYRWVLDALLSVKFFDLVVINTDAKHVLEKMGGFDASRVLIRDRRPEICGDLVSMNRIIEDDLEDVDADIYFQTHTTNPLLQLESIESAVEKFIQLRDQDVFDSLFSVTKCQERLYREDASPVNHDLSHLIRTQDLAPLYVENSNFYIFSDESFAATSSRIGSRPCLFETKPIESIDIDTPEDWELAEIAFTYLAKKGRGM